MAIVSGAFTAQDQVSAAISVGQGDILRLNITSTDFVGTISAEQSMGGGAVWQPVGTFTIGADAISGPGIFRLRCFHYSSGTANYSLTNVDVTVDPPPVTVVGEEFVINGDYCDNTGTTDVTDAFTVMARRACGLDDDGTGVVGTAKPIRIGPGSYLLKAWSPTDSSGYGLPVNLTASPGSVRILNRLSLSNTRSGAIDMDYESWQSANKVQVAVTSVTEGYAPATFGFPAAANNDDTVSILNVADSTGFSEGDCATIICQNNLPHTNSSSSKSRIGESFRVLNVDATHIYVHGRLSFHDFYESAIYVTRYNTTRTFRAYGINFEGAATTIGRTTATPSQLDHGVWGRTTSSIVSINRSGTTATVITALPHNLTAGQFVHITGAVEDNYNVTVAVAIVDATTFTYAMPTKNDANTTFGTAPGSASTPATGTIVYADAFAPLDTNTLTTAVVIRNAVGASFDNCEFNDCWGSGVRFYCSPEWRVRNLNSRGLPNAGTSALAYGGGRLGYVVLAYGHSSNGVWSGGTVRNSRHAFTTGGKDAGYTPTVDGSSAAWTVLGQPTQILIKNVDAYEAWGIPFDTHEEGSDIVFENCHVYNPQRGPQGGSYTGTGFQNRSRNTRFINCSQRGGQFGIRNQATEQLGIAAGYGVSSIPAPLTYTVTSLTQAAGVATFVHGTGINSVNTGAHLMPGDMIRIRGAINDTDQGNYSVTVPVLTYTESTKTGTFTLPTKDDLGNTFAVAPASVSTPATGTITLQPFARNQMVVHNFQFDGLRKGKSGGLILDRQNSLSWKSKVLVNGLTGTRTQNLINADDAVVVDADNLVASQLVYDSSSDQSGCVIGTLNVAVVHVGRMTLDVTDSISNAPGIYPARMSNASTVTIGHLHLKQHPTYLACPRVFENKDATSGKIVGLGKLTYDNPGGLAPSTSFAIIKIGQEANFTWLFGGEELSIPCQTAAITNATVTVGQRSCFNRFVLRRAGVMLDANAVGTVTVDVKANGTTIFGASKIVVAAGAASSDAAVPTYSNLLLPDPCALTATVISTSGAETAKLNNVSLTGYYV